jgi:mRNA-degrading endonuclease RelE of RelBE toxin-antitoxin system
MRYEIIPTPNFSKEFKRLAKKYPSFKEEYFLNTDGKD